MCFFRLQIWRFKTWPTPPPTFSFFRRSRSRARLQQLAMSKKVDTSFMKLVATDAEWSKEVAEGGGKVLCSASSHAAFSFILLFCRISHTLVSARTRAVIDVYNATWGPCEMIAGHCSNWFFDLGEKYGIKFVRAAADKVGALKEYTGKSESTFLLYLNGEQIEVIPGANIPAILKGIKEKAPALEG